MCINDVLTEVSLGSNQINDKGVEYLRELLENNSSLKLLDISKNEFGDEGFKEFCIGIKKNTGIHFLDISRNKSITDYAGMESLTDALRHN